LLTQVSEDYSRCGKCGGGAEVESYLQNVCKYRSAEWTVTGCVQRIRL